MWSAETCYVKHMRRHDGRPTAFPNMLNTIPFPSDELATYSYVQTKNAGEFVAIVLQVKALQPSFTETGEPYLSVQSSLDMEGRAGAPFRMWRFADGELILNHIYMIRGLKVMAEMYWDSWSQSRQPSENGKMRLERCFRTAVEDVTELEEFAEYF